MQTGGEQAKALDAALLIESFIDWKRIAREKLGDTLITKKFKKY